MSAKNIVLVHGAWADGSSWSGVIERLQAAGYNVTAPQFPLTSLDADLARLREVLAMQDGPTLVVAHSYGGIIMTALGRDAPNVTGLVYVASFGLDEGENVEELLSQGPSPPALAHLRVDDRGLAWLPQNDFLSYFAPDVDRVKANVMYAVQQPVPFAGFKTRMTTPAWKSFPSWFIVATNDQVIPPDGERMFAKRMGASTAEVQSSHVVMVSHPDVVADLVMQSAKAVAKIPA